MVTAPYFVYTARVLPGVLERWPYITGTIREFYVDDLRGCLMWYKQQPATVELDEAYRILFLLREEIRQKLGIDVEHPEAVYLAPEDVPEVANSVPENPTWAPLVGDRSEEFERARHENRRKIMEAFRIPSPKEPK